MARSIHPELYDVGNLVVLRGWYDKDRKCRKIKTKWNLPSDKQPQRNHQNRDAHSAAKLSKLPQHSLRANLLMS